MRFRFLFVVLVVLVAGCAPASRSERPVVMVRTVAVPSPAVPAADAAARAQLAAWLDGVHQAQLAAWYETASRPPAPQPRHVAVTYGGGRCGGSLPPCSVMMCESGGSLTAHNPRSTASGKWQILDTTWNGYDGYRHASDAPENVQDARAREIYAGGRGRSAWVC